jgi:hypothetical protein
MEVNMTIDNIEITPEMIEAGREVMRQFGLDAVYTSEPELITQFLQECFTRMNAIPKWDNH